MSKEKLVYTFFWTIKNYSYCWHKNNEQLFSPNFTIDKLDGTTWYLSLYPRGNEEDKGYISLLLVRDEEDEGPEKVPLYYELTVIAVDGSATGSGQFIDTFKRGDGYGLGRLIEIDELILRKKHHYLPQDTLILRCEIRSGDGKVLNIGQSTAETKISIEKYSFLHVVENFSSLQPNVKQTIEIKSHSKKECFISVSVHFTEGSCCEKKIMIEVIPSDTNMNLHICELFLLDCSRNIEKCVKIDNRYDVLGKSIHTLPLSLTRERILNKESEYLPDDKLSLVFDCTFSAGIEYETIRKTVTDIPSAVVLKLKSRYNVPKRNVPDTYPSVFEDMKALYINQCLTDVELKTETKSFLAHKIVLCARSPVFNAILTNDMNEKNTNCIHVVDLENDIIQQLLFFLYSDSIEDLQWDTATQLYYAADKYQVRKLKEVCSSFLEENLTTNNAGKLLFLADTHNDSHLKKSVEDFIWEHEVEVFGSKEWHEIAETNPQLALETMLLKYKRKKEI